MLFKDSDDTLAASILNSDENEDAKISLFAISLATEDDVTTLRYEGRFPNEGVGETSSNSNYGSRHVRAMSQGKYKEGEGFTSFSSGAGMSMEMSNNTSDSDGSGVIDSFSYRVKGFFANDENFYTVNYSGSGATIASVSSPTEYPTDSLSSMPDALEFKGSSDQSLGFIHDQTDANYTDSASWHKSNGPLAFDGVEYGD